MNIRLQQASNENTEIVSKLVFSVLDEYGLKADTNEVDSDLLDIEGCYINRGGTFKVLFDRLGQLIACYGLYKNSAQECELRKMYLEKSFRGQGLGKFLLEDAIKEAKRRRFQKITLETANVLKQAMYLYEQYGFKRFDAEHLSSRCDSAYYLELN